MLQCNPVGSEVRKRMARIQITYNDIKTLKERQDELDKLSNEDVLGSIDDMLQKYASDPGDDAAQRTLNDVARLIMSIRFELGGWGSSQ